LKAARPKRTEALTGLGIRWELARAQHYLGSDPNVDATERERYEKEALQNARFIDRFPGRYREAARRMIRHLSRS
jgi:hypothetical protein